MNISINVTIRDEDQEHAPVIKQAIRAACFAAMNQINKHGIPSVDDDITLSIPGASADMFRVD